MRGQRQKRKGEDLGVEGDRAETQGTRSEVTQEEGRGKWLAISYKTLRWLLFDATKLST